MVLRPKPGEDNFIPVHSKVSISSCASRLDIMAMTSELLEQAYEKIFRYCCLEFRQFGKDAQLDVAPVTREAVRRLRQRPELLRYVQL
jgi:conserved oligomeric Golgi complex subunit 6